MSGDLALRARILRMRLAATRAAFGGSEEAGTLLGMLVDLADETATLAELTAEAQRALGLKPGATRRLRVVGDGRKA